MSAQDSTTGKRLSASSAKFVDWERQLRRALKSNSEADVTEVLKHMSGELVRIERELDGPIEESWINGVYQGRPIGFALASPLSKHAYQTVNDLASSSSSVGIFVPKKVNGRRTVRSSVQDGLAEVTEIGGRSHPATPLQRLGNLENRLIELSYEGVDEAYDNLPNIYKPIHEAHAEYLEWSAQIANKHPENNYGFVTPADAQKIAVREGGAKINRFAELVARLHVQFGEPRGEQGLVALFDNSTFVRESALQAPGAVLVCQRVLTCNAGCFATDLDDLLGSLHGPSLATALEARPQEQHEALIAGFRKGHYRKFTYNHLKWTIARNRSGLLEVTPAVDLATEIDPQSGLLISDLPIDLNSIIGCAAVPGHTLTQQIELHRDAHNCSAAWGNYVSTYRNANAGRPNRPLADTPIYPLPFSSAQKTGLIPETS